MEAATDALEAIGPAAVEEVVRHLNDDDSSRYIYLTGTLGNIPTEASAQALLDRVSMDQMPDEMEIVNLVDTGSAIGIEPLYKLVKHYRASLGSNLDYTVSPNLMAWNSFILTSERINTPRATTNKATNRA